MQATHPNVDAEENQPNQLQHIITNQHSDNNINTQPETDQQCQNDTYRDPFAKFKYNQPQITSTGLTTFYTKNQVEATKEQLLIYSVLPKSRIKEQNLQKYNMKTDSPLYYYHVKQCEEMLKDYPSEFPTELRQEIKRDVWWPNVKINIVTMSLVATISGFLVCRTSNWYMLTGHRWLPIVYYVFGKCYLLTQHNKYFHLMQKKVFMHNKYFQDAVMKHNIGPKDYLF